MVIVQTMKQINMQRNFMNDINSRLTTTIERQLKEVLFFIFSITSQSPFHFTPTPVIKMEE